MAARPIRVEGGVGFVPLTQGYTALIDAADAPFVGQWNWCAIVGKWTVYAKRVEWRDGKAFSIYLHRALLTVGIGQEVDHRFGNGLDNRRSNLRVATPTQNQQNSNLRKDNTSGVKGVSTRENGKFQAAIRYGGNKVHLGTFGAIEEASAAYQEASMKHHADFRRV